MGSRPIEDKITKKQLDAFFTHLNLTGNVKASCVKANMLRRQIYRLRERDVEIATDGRRRLNPPVTISTPKSLAAARMAG